MSSTVTLFPDASKPTGAGLIQTPLFVTSIRPDGIGLSDQPLASGLFALRPGVRGPAAAACVI